MVAANVNIEKIQKILNLMDRAGTQGEAEAAAAALQRELTKQNLTEAEARSAGQFDENVYVRIDITLASRKERGLTWKVYLMHALADYHFCRWFRYGKHGGKGLVIGTERNIAVLRQSYTQLSEVFPTIAVARWNSLTEWQRSGLNKVSFINSFLMGVPSGLRHAFEQARRGQYETMDGVQALVLVTDQELNAAQAKLVGRVLNAGKDTISSASGWNAGFEAGKNHQHATPLAEKEGRLAIG